MEILNKLPEYKSNNTTVYRCVYHIIWCTKYRRNVLNDEMQSFLKELLLKYNNDNEHFNILEMEVMENHVHILIEIDPDYAISKVLSILKGTSSSEMCKKFPELRSRLPSLWTRSKFIATVGSVSLEIVKKYIEDQKSK